MGRFTATATIRGADLGLKRIPGEITVQAAMEFREQEMERGPDGHTRVKQPKTTEPPKPAKK